jgi:hypothetical protein
MFRILAIVATLLGAASAAQADVYRWTDANGTVQYSDRWVPGSTLVKSERSRPADAESEPQSQTPSPASNDPPAAATDAVTQQESERTVQQDMARLKAEKCKQVREQYDRALQSRRIFRENEKGERTFMSDPEADAYRVELLSRRKEACGS